MDFSREQRVAVCIGVMGTYKSFVRSAPWLRIPATDVLHRVCKMVMVSSGFRGYSYVLEILPDLFFLFARVTTTRLSRISMLTYNPSGTTVNGLQSKSTLELVHPMKSFCMSQSRVYDACSHPHQPVRAIFGQK